MSLFGKSRIEDLPSFTADSEALPAEEVRTVSKEVELVALIRNEFSVSISGILRQSQKKLQETNNSLGRIESRLHNVKIYQESLKRMAELLEMKLLHMRGGSPETVDQDLAEEELNVIIYLKGVSAHLSAVIIELRDLRRLLSKVSVVPTDPQMPPLESGREFGSKVVEIIHKVEQDLKLMHLNLEQIYELEDEVTSVAKEHNVIFPGEIPSNQVQQ